MTHLLHRGKLAITAMALACGGLASSVAAAQAAPAATHPAAASAHAQPGSPYQPPDPCLTWCRPQQGGISQLAAAHGIQFLPTESP